jgi:DNA helicase-2/ATP-dependent DNA helicase PcrA
MNPYTEALQGLNTEQRRAVQTIDGPVMVVAGPGTGKTQVLSLRIAHILDSTDTPADGVLCLTFTNAGVKAMRERLLRLIGPTATKVRVSTFHAFALDVIEEFHEAVTERGVPELLENTAAITFFDEILTTREWKYVRPRANPSMYFRDLKSLIGVLKRDRITPEDFRTKVAAEIEQITADPANISSRGETKGQLKKEAQSRIDSLSRSLEVADFYETYEALKTERGLIDYNDVLELLVKIVEQSDEAAATIRERYLYVLVDEHQDSTGIQNEFLKKVWGEVEQPNLFVVGDDRQLIYGFGGASLAYFEGFKSAFGKAELITLTHNYRSTQVVLDAAETLLQSAMADGKLIGSTESAHQLQLVECDYPRDEILRAGLDIKMKIAEGMDPNHFAILVPKNYQVKAAVEILRDMGLPVAAVSSLRLFELPDTKRFFTILEAINKPFDPIALSRTLLDPLTGISSINGHAFLAGTNPRKLTINTILESEDGEIAQWGKRLQTWIELSATTDAYGLIQMIGTELLLADVTDDEVLRRRVEIIRTLLHLALAQTAKQGQVMLVDFLVFIDRLQSYDEDIPLAVFGAQEGIKVLTLHGSKGLEFESVWIAHMDERSLMGSRRAAFALPDDIAAMQAENSIDVAKRQLYVAMTRAKKYLAISYARQSYTGGDQDLASIILELPETIWQKESREESEKILLAHDARTFVLKAAPQQIDQTERIKVLVAAEYEKKKVSVTMLNNFFECPWKWYFRNLLCLPEPLNDSLHVGNVVHETIEYILHGWHDAEAELERTAHIESRGDEIQTKRYMNEARPIIESWQTKYATELVKPYEVEKMLFYHDAEFAHLTITGKIDVVESIITDEVRVTDWKTGSTKTSGEIDKEDEEGRMSSYLRQLSMYSYLINGVSRGNISVSESRLVFLEAKLGDKNAIQSRKISSTEIERLRQDIKDYDQYIKDGSWMTRPCCTKTYGAGEKCEYCAMAERFGIK